MRKIVSLAAPLLLLSVSPVFAQTTGTPSSGIQPAEAQPAETENAASSPATEPESTQPSGEGANVTIIEPTEEPLRDPTGAGAQTLTDAQEALQRAAEQLQGATDDNLQLASDEAGQALDQFEQSLQDPANNVPGDQQDTLRQQVEQARQQLEDNPRQAGMTLQELASNTQSVASSPQQLDVSAEADQIVGKAILGTDGEEVGDIADVLVTSDGQVEAVLIDQGGALGLGGRQVALTWDQLQFQGDQISVNMTGADIEQLPDYVAD